MSDTETTPAPRVLIIGAEIDGHELPPHGIVRAGDEILSATLVPDGKRILSPEQAAALMKPAPVGEDE